MKNLLKRAAIATVFLIELVLPISALAQSNLAAWFGQERYDYTSTTTRFNDFKQNQDQSGGFRYTARSNGSVKATQWSQLEGPYAKRGFGSTLADNYSSWISGYGSGNPGAYSSDQKYTITETRTPYKDSSLGNIIGEFVDFKSTYHSFSSPVPAGGNPPDVNYSFQTVDPKLNIERANLSWIHYACKGEDKYIFDENLLPTSITHNESTTTVTSSRVPVLIYQKFGDSPEPVGTVRRLCWTMSTAVVPYSVFGGLGGYWPGGNISDSSGTYKPTAKSYCLYPSRANGGQSVVNGPSVSTQYLANNTCRLYSFQIDSFDRVPRPPNYRPDTIIATATSAAVAAQLAAKPTTVIPVASPTPSATPAVTPGAIR